MRHYFIFPALLATFLYVSAGCVSVEDRYRVAQGKDTIYAYKDFLGQHDKGNFAEAARRRIKEADWLEAIEYAKAYAIAVKSVQPVVLKHHLALYPDSQHSQIILERLKTIEDIKRDLASEKFSSIFKVGASVESIVNVQGEPDLPFERSGFGGFEFELMATYYLIEKSELIGYARVT